MRQKLYLYLPERCLVLTKYLKTFGKTIDVRINKTYLVYNDSKIYRVRETKIEDTDILKAEKTPGSFKSFRR
jgi:hypothetical protein